MKSPRVNGRKSAKACRRPHIAGNSSQSQIIGYITQHHPTHKASLSLLWFGLSSNGLAPLVTFIPLKIYIVHTECLKKLLTKQNAAGA